MSRITKKDLALSLYSAGRSVQDIAAALSTSPTYIANVLVNAGKSPEYADLYVSTAAQEGYARMFRGVLRFRSPQSAAESVRRIDELYNRFARANDRRGMHQAQLIALTGRNRAEGMGKLKEAQMFADWLTDHLAVRERQFVPDRAADSDKENLFSRNLRRA